MEKREKSIWCGEYRGVAWEIQRWPGFKCESMRLNKWNWTMYLYLHLDRIPENSDSYWLLPRKDYGRVNYDYYAHGILSSIAWNGGITWYSKESGLDGSPRVIKVGCDFQHSWDHEHGDYDIENILHAVIEAVDSFRVMVPDYRYWCRQDGKLHDPKEVEILPDGGYRCQCALKLSEAKKEIGRLRNEQ